jgi:transcriptional regulator with XRE-family HTH domain
MSIQVYEQIERLCKQNGIAVTRLESDLGFGRGSIGKMKKGGNASAERIQKIADYFHVPIGVLTGGFIQFSPNEFQDIFDTQNIQGLSDVIDMYKAFDDQDRKEVLVLMESKMRKYKKGE